MLRRVSEPWGPWLGWETRGLGLQRGGGLGCKGMQHNGAWDPRKEPWEGWGGGRAQAG